MDTKTVNLKYDLHLDVPANMVHSMLQSANFIKSLDASILEVKPSNTQFRQMEVTSIGKPKVFVDYVLVGNPRKSTFVIRNLPFPNVSRVVCSLWFANQKDTTRLACTVSICFRSKMFFLNYVLKQILLRHQIGKAVRNVRKKLHVYSTDSHTSHQPSELQNPQKP